VEKDNNYCWFSSPFSFCVSPFPFAGFEVSFCATAAAIQEKVFAGIPLLPPLFTASL
jgi:hypothetical protein